MPYRPAKAYINLPALRHNLNVAKQLAPNSKILAVIKANGYGHGIIRVAKQLALADGFGVASIDEALLLRQKGFLHRILLLEGVFSSSEIEIAIQNRIDFVIHSFHQLDWLLNFPTTTVLNIWIKVDSGMHRLGFSPQVIPHVIQQLENNSNCFNIHMMSHLASADGRDLKSIEFTEFQVTCFDDATNQYDFPKSIVNSSGLVNYPIGHLDWVRPGILLYGVGFDSKDRVLRTALKAVMRLESEVIALKQIPKGDSVGYSNAWMAKRESTIAVIAIGYGDGYPRHASEGTPVLINQIRMPLVGRVSMDMITVDVTDYVEKVHIGDLAILWGEQLSIDEVARYSGTISYELLCGITQRVPLIEVQ